MQGQPNGFFFPIGRLDAVPVVRRDFDPVTGAQHERHRFPFKSERCLAGQQRDPLVLFLVVPISRRRGLACRYNPLQPEPATG